jgi:ABC-type transporter Mla maintaining outer membrane lipid asymmetry ATPase subunit MlaF
VLPVVHISGVVRNYQALRPLRIASLTVHEGERVSILGVDAGGAEALVNLLTGAALPDEGRVRIFGRDTSDISGGDEWLASLDRFGIVSPRAVIMEASTVRQNLAMPFTLQIDPVPPDIAARVEALARESGISRELLETPAAEIAPEIRARLHLARAIALDPALLVLEHPTAGIDASALRTFADDVARAVEGRQLTALAITQDQTFATRVGHRTVKLQPATGELKPLRRGWLW